MSLLIRGLGGIRKGCWSAGSESNSGKCSSYVLWVTGESPHSRMFWVLKGPDNDWTNVTKEKVSGTKRCGDLTADSATNGVKLDRYLVEWDCGLLGS